MNEFGFATAPDWVQAAMIVGEMLRAFAGRHTTTILSLTEEQSDAVRFAGAYMEGHSAQFAEVLMERLLRPLDAMPYCESEECYAKSSSCHVHKPAVAAAIIKRWVETGTPKALAIHGAEVLDDAWKMLSDLVRTTEHPTTKQCLDDLAHAAFDKAREIVKEEIHTTEDKDEEIHSLRAKLAEAEKERDAALDDAKRMREAAEHVIICWQLEQDAVTFKPAMDSFIADLVTAIQPSSLCPDLRAECDAASEGEKEAKP